MGFFHTDWTRLLRKSTALTEMLVGAINIVAASTGFIESIQMFGPDLILES